MLSKERLESVRNGEIIGTEILFLDSTTSTNDVAMETARKREKPEGIVVIADSQTHGKGRLGRKWLSPPGVNLYFTVLLKPPFSPPEAQLATLAAAVAVATAVREFAGIKAEIKWPNDILVNGKKTGGILLEMKTGRSGINILCIGIGINVNMSMDELPEDIRSLSTSLKTESGSHIDRAEFLGCILAEMERTYKILLNDDKRALINEWIHLNCTVGNKVTVKCHDKVVTGTAEGINDYGELIVRLSSGRLETLSAGDVTILKD